jgi:hypothetical protein
MKTPRVIEDIKNHEIMYDYFALEMPPYRITKQEHDDLKAYHCRYMSPEECKQYKGELIGYYMGVELEVVIPYEQAKKILQE